MLSSRNDGAPMVLSIQTNAEAGYPEPGSDYSPSESYPEYAWDSLSPTPNPVYAMVRSTFAQAGLDKEHLGSSEWNPLGTWIARGARVFVLCNFVYQRRVHEDDLTFQSKCIHGSVLRALIDYVLLAVGSDGRVAFGNSPVQATSWESVLRDSGADRVARFYQAAGAPVRAVDLRLFVAERSLLGHVRSVERREDADGISVRLDDESLLAQFPKAKQTTAPFRISDYDPRRIEGFHAGGRHEYVIHREVLEADVVISLSKLKTHEKVGITCGLKGFVGSVGHKDCLAHHRFGNPAVGGDEYPDSNAWLRPFSRLLDRVNRREPGAPLQRLAHIVTRTLGRILRRSGVITTGAWHGNDTCWRMALDLARILTYADARGALSRSVQRRHLSLIDGIVAGERNGPLDPTPVRAGVLIFGDDVAVADRAAARLMGFPPQKVPIVSRAFQLDELPVSTVRPDQSVDCILDGHHVDERAIPPILGRPFLPPDGWRAHLEISD